MKHIPANPGLPIQDQYSCIPDKNKRYRLRHPEMQKVSNMRYRRSAKGLKFLARWRKEYYEGFKASKRTIKDLQCRFSFLEHVKVKEWINDNQVKDKTLQANIVYVDDFNDYIKERERALIKKPYYEFKEV